MPNKIERLKKDLHKAEVSAKKWANRRQSLEPGTSRAKVTTVNARWRSAAEDRDRIAKQLGEAIVSEGMDNEMHEWEEMETI